jgi:hypothetical protein
MRKPCLSRLMRGVIAFFERFLVGVRRSGLREETSFLTLGARDRPDTMRGCGGQVCRLLGAPIR